MAVHFGPYRCRSSDVHPERGYCVALHACFHIMQTSKVGGVSQQEVASRLVCAAGLAEMEFGKYKNAARLLTKACVEHCKFQDVSPLQEHVNVMPCC